MFFKKILYTLRRSKRRLEKFFRRRILRQKPQPIDSFASHREMERMFPGIWEKDWTGWKP